MELPVICGAMTLKWRHSNDHQRHTIYCPNPYNWGMWCLFWVKCLIDYMLPRWAAEVGSGAARCAPLCTLDMVLTSLHLRYAKCTSPGAVGGAHLLAPPGLNFWGVHYIFDQVQQVLGGALQWRHNGLDGVSKYQHHDCLLSRLFRRRSKKTPMLHVTGLCVGNSPGTSEFPTQMASSA